MRCPRCEQTYRLGYSDTEWNKVKDWLRLAATAIRKDHDLRHEAATIPLRVARHTETVKVPGRKAVLAQGILPVEATPDLTRLPHKWLPGGVGRPFATSRLKQ